MPASGWGILRGLAKGAEHPVGRRPQAGAVLLESMYQSIVFVHICHIPSSRFVFVVVTNETRPKRGEIDFLYGYGES